jgi:transposase
MDALSQDLRDRVVAACQEPGSIRIDVAERFCVSTSWIRKLFQRLRETGSYSAKPPSGGLASRVQEPQLQEIKTLVHQQPDAKLTELCDRLEDTQQVRLSPSSMSATLKKLKLPRKKSRCIPANATRSGCRSCGKPGGLS